MRVSGPGGVIDEIRSGSLAAEMGLLPGDRVLSIDGQPLRDILDYRFHVSGEQLEMEIQRADGQLWIVDLEKDPDETLGVTFTSDLFDGMIGCGNLCPFCFVDQLPQGLRSSLYVKDDDYRLSFLNGNFVTLTNLSEADMDRIQEQRLSPLYVSVHATDPEIRARLLGTGQPAPIMGLVSDLVDAGIIVHAQIVLCPGINDGEILERTIADLSGLYPGVASIGIVPVGLTDHRQRSAVVEPVTDDAARILVDQVHLWQSGFRERTGCGLVYLADEIYLLAGDGIPRAENYDSFPQLDNGIGSWRYFEDGFTRAAGAERHRLQGTVAAGTLAAPLLRELVQGTASEDSTAAVLGVPSRFLGPGITVSGLMVGGDLVAAAREHGVSGRILIPSSVICDQAYGGCFLDGMTLEEVEDKLGTSVVSVPVDGRELFEALRENGGDGS